MLFRFIGTYTNKRDSITMCGVTFEGHEFSEVVDEAAIARLSNNIEFEADGDDGEPAIVKPRRGRKPRNADLS
jgi:hypothetical protein